AFAKSVASDFTASFTLDNSILSGTATAMATNPFGGLIGTKTYPVSVRAAATQATTPVCVLGLNNSEKGGFDINGGPIFNASSAVQANSKNSSGMSQEGKSASAKAKKFAVQGGHDTTSYSPPPSDNSPVISDPYASLPFPAYDTSCDPKTQAMVINVDTT